MIVDNFQSFRGVARFQGDVAKTLDLGDHISAHQRIVLDDQHNLMPTLDARGSLRLRGGLIQSGGAWQIDLDRRSVTFLAVNLDMPARLLDEAEHHAETEAGALADFLCREEGVEDLFDIG